MLFTVNLFTGVTQSCEIVVNIFFCLCVCFFLYVSIRPSFNTVKGIPLESLPRCYLNDLTYNMVWYKESFVWMSSGCF